ncbi:MAG: helix-turn-helix transcriptional regulator [Bryobacteraceae bacterium]|nr:helix-turn-helix transcriptional regulator [Bryobacteraceae bacterium]
MAREHEHAEAQIVLPFTATPLNLHMHGATGNSTIATLRGGFASVIPFDQPHRLRWQGEGDFINLYFTKQWLDVSGAHLLSIDPHACWDDPLVREVAIHLREEYAAFGLLDPMVIDHSTALIALRLSFGQRLTDKLVPQRRKSLLPRRQLQPALVLMHDNIAGQLVVRDLARACGSSTFHFARSFSYQYGCPPAEYQRRLRISRAKQLILTRREYPIALIGAEVGMYSAAHFSRVFLKYAGMTPSEYRARFTQPRLPVNRTDVVSGPPFLPGTESQD